ncbi:MAG: D-alanyl-D-alanine carboxypeptidase/D-alanyl-D-alanine-endopeptidase [Bradymonadia bacterium]
MNVVPSMPLSPPLLTVLAFASLTPLTAWSQPAPDEDAPPAKAAPQPPRTRDLQISGVPALVKRLKPILDEEILKGAKVSIVVERLDRRKKSRLFAVNPDLALHPASNTKVVTTSAALSLLSPAHTWNTDLAAPKDETGGKVSDLYLIGRGDPRFVNESLWSLVTKAKRKGLTEVTGDIVVDDTRFTADRMAPGFDDKNQDDAYRAASGAMSLNFNSMVIQVKPGKAAGESPKVTLRPDSGYAVIENTATTTSKGRTSVAVKAGAYKDRTLIRVSGRIPLKSKGATVRKRIDNPALFAGYGLKMFLEEAGIQVKGKVRVEAAPKKRRLLSREVSRTLALAAVDINKLSNNFMAEQVLRTLGVRKGAQGDWASGAKVVRRFLTQEVGLKGDFRYVNGSGLFGNTAFSAAQLVQLMRHMHTLRPPLPEFAASLPMNGVDGTLRRRLKELPPGTVRAKTGTLDGVVCLTGYLTMKGGKMAAFSILLNDLEGPAWKAWKVQDAILLALARYTP